MTLANMASWAKVKGIELLLTADFTHPDWLSELEENLVPTTDGDFALGRERFVLGTEISCVYKPACRARRVHRLLYAPTFEAVHSIRQIFEKLASKPNSDGCPQVGRELTARLPDIDDACMVALAHIGTTMVWGVGIKIRIRFIRRTLR